MEQAGVKPVGPGPQNERWTSFFSHLMLIVLVACLGIGCLHLGKYLAPGWDTTGLLGLFIFITLEAILSARLEVPAESRLTYRISEWIVILILTKLFTELRFGVAYFVHNLQAWSTDFLPSFFTTALFVNVVLVVFLWGATTLFARNLKDLEGDELLVSDNGLPVDRRSLHQEILKRIMMLGLLLVAFAGIIRLDPLHMPPAPSGSLQDISFIFVYFFSGLVLLSLTNFASLRASWIFERANVRKDLAPPWIVTSIIFIAVVTLLATLLPTRYSFGLLDLVAYLLKILAYIFKLVAAAILYVLALIYELFYRLLGRPALLPSEALHPLNLDQLLKTPPAQTSQPAWWVYAKTLAFWTFLAVALVYAFSQYLLHNQQFVDALRRSPLARWLAGISDWVQTLFRRVRTNVQTAIQSRMVQRRARRAAPQPPQAGALVNLRRLTARQRVLFYYHALVHRAASAGFVRLPWMTPGEYARRLEDELTETGEEIGLLTGAFVEARYSRHPVGEDRARQVKSVWEHIRSSLRRRPGKTTSSGDNV